MAWLLWREPFTIRKIGAICLAVLGTVLVARVYTLNSVQLTKTGLMIGLTSAFSYSLYSIFGKKLRGEYNPWTVLLYSFGFASLALLPFQLNSSVPIVIIPSVVFSFAALVFVPTIIGYGLYTIGLGRIPASVAAVIATAEVPIASIYAFFALSERLNVGQILGAILIICGVILVSMPGKKR
jgi:drug/metabolite transporter (DMT)-like permease